MEQDPLMLHKRGGVSSALPTSRNSSERYPLSMRFYQQDRLLTSFQIYFTARIAFQPWALLKPGQRRTRG